MLQAVAAVSDALDDFYATLSEEQKTQFEAVGPSWDNPAIGLIAVRSSPAGVPPPLTGPSLRLLYSTSALTALRRSRLGMTFTTASLPSQTVSRSVDLFGRHYPDLRWSGLVRVTDCQKQYVIPTSHPSVFGVNGQSENA